MDAKVYKFYIFHYIMESKIGSILTLIGGILTLIGSVVFLIIALLFFNFYFLADKVAREIPEIPMAFLGTILIIVFMFVFIMGFLKIYAFNLMRRPESTLRGGIIAVIAGILVSDIFSLVGGIFGIVQGSEKANTRNIEKRKTKEKKIQKKRRMKR